MFKKKNYDCVLLQNKKPLKNTIMRDLALEKEIGMPLLVITNN